jgi:tetratricopeptide (TPR) repeat protein
LGDIALGRKQYDEALQLSTRSLAKERDEGQKAMVLNNIATVHIVQGAYALAAGVFQQAIAIDRKLGNRQALAGHLLHLGVAYHKLKRVQDESQALNEGLQTAREVGDRYGEGLGLQYLGRSLRDRGEPAQARESFNQALKVFREIGAQNQIQQTQVFLNAMGETK